MTVEFRLAKPSTNPPRSVPLRLRKSLDQPYVVPADKRDFRWWLQQIATRRGALAALALVFVVGALAVAAKVGPFSTSKLVPPVVIGIGDTGIRARVIGTPGVTPPSAKSAPQRAANSPAGSHAKAASAPAAVTGKSTPAPASPNTQVAPATDPARALTTMGALEAGIIAYRKVSYDEAARLLRIAITGGDNGTLTPSAQTTALMYLGASELLLQRRDSAAASFRALLANAPRHRADTLTFPKVVTDFYDGVRRSLHGVARIAEIDNGVRVTVLAINPHRVSVDVQSEGGTKIVGLYDGPSADSLSVDWDERGADKLPVASGRYNIVVTARALDGRLLSVGRFPVVIDRAPESSGSGR